MKDDDFKLLRGLADGQMDKQTDIYDCRVAFATENMLLPKNDATWPYNVPIYILLILLNSSEKLGPNETLSILISLHLY